MGRRGESTKAESALPRKATFHPHDLTLELHISLEPHPQPPPGRRAAARSKRRSEGERNASLTPGEANSGWAASAR